MKNMNKGLGFLAIAGIAAAAIIVTHSFSEELITLVLGGFFIVGLLGN